jgi:2-polyprenyl-3-methyl-5-hydroxy-6-metoxy-1,4-benzoquinol methylase
MIFDTAWPETKTFFPLLVDYFGENEVTDLNILVIGAADGKFVIPLSKYAKNITALEFDQSCFVDTQGFECLPSKIKRYNLANVKIVQNDFQNFASDDRYDLIFTSCSWHYSRNKQFGLGNFIDKIASLILPNGLLFLEYMMPSEDWHYQEERYLAESQIFNHLDRKLGYKTIYSFYTDKFPEKAHFAVPYDHFHKMGVFMGKIL